jgi:ankyrin repeat protein
MSRLFPTLEILLKAGADPNLPVGQTAPATVVVTNPAMLRLLVKYGADLSSTDFGFSHSNIYHMLAYEDIEYPLAKEIILIIASSNKPPAIDALNGSLESPLYIAVWQGCIGVTRALLDLGANVNVINKYGSTAMHGLFEYLDEYLAKELRDLYSLLMEHGIDTSVKNEEGLTAKQV